MKITILDGYSLNPGDLSWEPLKKFGDVTVYDRTAPAEIIERAKGSEVLLTNKVVLNEETLHELPGLKYVGVLATGYNVVDVAAAKKLGIVVTNIPAYSTMSVAQKVFALLLAITDRVEHYAIENRSGRWSRNPDFCYWDTPLTELAGKTFGIVGFGHIGQAVAHIAIAFDMKVLAFTSTEPEHLPDGVTKADLNKLFSESDVVSLHCPLAPDTNRLVNRERLALMKPSAILINTGRGPLIDDDAVAEALRNGKLAAFGADVLTTEPPASDNPLLSAPNSYITPHIAWATKEARERLMQITLDNLDAYTKGSPINNVAR